MEPVSQQIGAGDDAGPEVESLPLLSGSRPPSDELRASLSAVRAARDAAQSRMRSDTRRIRVVSLMFLAAFTAGVLAVAGHFRKRHRGPVKAPVAAIVQAGAAGGGTPAQAGAAPSSAPSSASASASALGAGAAGADVVVAPEPSPAELAAAMNSCREAYEDHVWPIATDVCAHAAEMRPRDPALAMKVAQAFHARGRYADAGGWARRALALEGVDPEALVILAHAERRAGHPAAAKTAYRRYLVLAPRGWHAAEARAAVRVAERPGAHARLESAAAGQGAAPYVSSLDSNTPRR